MLPNIVSDYCRTLPSDLQVACLEAESTLQAQLRGSPPDEGEHMEPRVLAFAVLLVLAFFAALANRKKHLSHCGLCLRLQCCYALLSRKNYEPDAKGGN